MARIELSNIGGGGTTLSLTTTGTSGASTLAGSVLNIPVYQGQLALTTTGTSGAATLVGDTLNIPNYATGGNPAGSAGQIQFNSTPSGSFAASANLAWDNTAVQLNINAPASPTGKLNVKGSGATSSTVNTRLTDSGNTELLKVLDNGSTNIGANFNWDNVNGRLGLGTSTPNQTLEVSGAMRLTGTAGTAAFMLGRNSAGDVSTVTLTTTGTGGAATLSGNALNIPIYSGGASPGGSTGEIQYNNAGAFGASANLSWVNSPNPQLNIGAPSAPTGRLNIKGAGTTSSTLNLSLTNSGNTNIFRVWDDATTQIGSNFYWDNANSRLGIGTTTPTMPLSVVMPSTSANAFRIDRSGVTDGFFQVVNYTGAVGTFSPVFWTKSNFSTVGTTFLFDATTDVSTNGPIGSFSVRANNTQSANRTLFDFNNSDPSELGGKSVMRIFASSNISIQNGGTPLNNGYRLDVNANNATHAARFRAPNATGGTNAILIQNNNPDDLYKIEANGKVSYLATNTSAGTTGAQTINRPSGTVNFGIGASSLVVTNSLCTTASIVFATVRTNDATAQIKNVVPAAGSFTINLSAAATAETSVGFFIIN